MAVAPQPIEFSDVSFSELATAQFADFLTASGESTHIEVVDGRHVYDDALLHAADIVARAYIRALRAHQASGDAMYAGRFMRTSLRVRVAYAELAEARAHMRDAEPATAGRAHDEAIARQARVQLESELPARGVTIGEVQVNVAAAAGAALEITMQLAWPRV
jgi:hypothetical protein